MIQEYAKFQGLNKQQIRKEFNNYKRKIENKIKNIEVQKEELHKLTDKNDKSNRKLRSTRELHVYQRMAEAMKQYIGVINRGDLSWNTVKSAAHAAVEMEKA